LLQKKVREIKLRIIKHSCEINWMAEVTKMIPKYSINKLFRQQKNVSPVYATFIYSGSKVADKDYQIGTSATGIPISFVVLASRMQF